MEIPEIAGCLDLDELLEWLQTVERIFYCKDLPENETVKIMALKLKEICMVVLGKSC